MHRDFRKPLIAFTSKKLLRYKPVIIKQQPHFLISVNTSQACSNLREFTEHIGTANAFRNVVPEVETLVEDAKVKKAVLCSG